MGTAPSCDPRVLWIQRGIQWIVATAAGAFAGTLAAIGGRMEIVRIRQGLAQPAARGRAVGAVALGLTDLLDVAVPLGFLVWAAAHWV
jgi:hypothetical protein